MEEKFYLDNGEECSRAAYIRQEFEKNRSRNDIAEELDVKYYTVYAATANMHNDHHPEGGATGARTKMVPRVNENFEFVDAEGEVVETEEEAEVVARPELMRALFEAGKTRAEIKDYFGVKYATVYSATRSKDGTTSRATKMVVHPETGEEIKRADYIRELYNDGEGLTRKEIAEKLTLMTGELVDYAAVWAATKSNKVKDEVEVEVEVEEEEEVVEE